MDDKNKKPAHLLVLKIIGFIGIVCLNEIAL